jgi:hypothetical protein
VRTHSLRVALVLALVVVVGGVAATVAHALAFDDGTPCSRPGSTTVFVCPKGTVGTAYSITLVSYGGCGPALPYQYRVLNGSLPPGLSLSSNGVISGTPTTAGVYDFYLELSDQNPPSAGWCLPKTAEQPFRMSIDPRVIVTTQAAPPGTVGASYNLPLQAQMMSAPNQFSAPSSPLSWSVTGQLPPGLLLDQTTGVVSGTPTTEGSFIATYKAALIDGRSDTKSLEIVVRKPLTITSAKPLATAPVPTLWEVGVPFSAKLTPAGGNGTYAFTLADGALPTGLALAADGTLAGTPKTAGVFRATVRLSDTEGRTTDLATNFGVAARLAISTLVLKPGRVGKLYRAKLSATGGLVPRVWKVTAGPLPRGIKLDRTLGVLSGTPTKPGSYRITVQVTDGLKVVATKTLRIIVAP